MKKWKKSSRWRAALKKADKPRNRIRLWRMINGSSPFKTLGEFREKLAEAMAKPSPWMQLLEGGKYEA